jgi:predicted transcriptional regulator
MTTIDTITDAQITTLRNLLVWEALVGSGTSMTASELALEVGTDINATQRALSYLLDLGMISDRGFGAFEARGIRTGSRP